MTTTHGPRTWYRASVRGLWRLVILTDGYGILIP
jgi:hypothetical protein